MVLRRTPTTHACRPQGVEFDDLPAVHPAVRDGRDVDDADRGEVTCATPLASLRTEPTRLSLPLMSLALIAALFFTVALLVTTTYFLLGSVPLLVLEHDTPMDSRFVRSFFNTYYLAAMGTASATALSYALAGRLAIASGAAALALLAAILRRKVIPTMDSLREEIQSSGTSAISAFRRIHTSAILINLAQLVVIVWTLIAVSRSLR